VLGEKSHIDRRRLGLLPPYFYGLWLTISGDAIMQKLILVIVAGAAVASCITSADLALRHCQELGIKPVTPEFNQCYYTTRQTTAGIFWGDNTPMFDPDPSSPYGPYRIYW
jgi:hypothetical protein